MLWRCARVRGCSEVATMLLLVTSLCCAGCGSRSSVPEPDQGRAVAERFFEQIRTGNASQAWEETGVEFKSAEGRDSFTRSMKKRAWLSKPVEFQAIETVNWPGGERAEYVYRSADGQHRARLLMGRNGEQWCVDALRFE